MGRHALPEGYPLEEPATKGSRYFYSPGSCWVQSLGSYEIKVCDWSPLPNYPEEDE